MGVELVLHCERGWVGRASKVKRKKRELPRLLGGVTPCLPACLVSVVRPPV